MTHLVILLLDGYAFVEYETQREMQWAYIGLQHVKALFYFSLEKKSHTLLFLSMHDIRWKKNDLF